MAAVAATHNNAWNASPSQQQQQQEQQPSHPLYPPAGNNASFLDSSANLLPGAAAPSPFSDTQAAREVGTGPEAPTAAAAAVAAAGPSPFGDSEGQGEVRVVVGTFDPKLDDELVLYVSRESQISWPGSSDQVKKLT